MLQETFIPLPALWRRAFPDIKYDCEKAQRRLLQMPVACLRLKDGCYVVEKTDGHYDDVKEKIVVSLANLSAVQDYKDSQMNNSVDEFKEYLNAAPNEAERRRMKHLMASTHNMSSRQAAKFGMFHVRKRAEKVVSAQRDIIAIIIYRVYQKKLHS